MTPLSFACSFSLSPITPGRPRAGLGRPASTRGRPAATFAAYGRTEGWPVTGEGGDAGTLSGALSDALDAAEHAPRDAAAVALARVYAGAIDATPGLVADLGPRYLAVLTALGMTPAGRGQKGGQTGEPPGPTTTFDELRDRRRRRRPGATG